MSEQTLISMKPVSEYADELARVLEPLVRRIVREELERVVERQPDVFVLQEDSPLYGDMVELARRSREGKIELLTYEQVWNQDAE
ncbi:MAG: hypothetical protein HY328_00030 [Chloroflexi bacterium]|nr:hypothetical protein [Chloroflexota bacterium]